MIRRLLFDKLNLERERSLPGVCAAAGGCSDMNTDHMASLLNLSSYGGSCLKLRSSEAVRTAYYRDWFLGFVFLIRTENTNIALFVIHVRGLGMALPCFRLLESGLQCSRSFPFRGKVESQKKMARKEGAWGGEVADIEKSVEDRRDRENGAGVG